MRAPLCLLTSALFIAAACAPSQVEVQRQQLADQVTSLHERLARVEARLTNLAQDVTLCQAVQSNHGKATAPSEPAYVPMTAPLPNADEALAQALQDYQHGSPNQAYAELAAWLQVYPGHPAADSARFWMGQCKFDLGEYSAAVEHFGRLPDTYPDSQKAPDALLKLGLAYERLHQRDQAATAFARLIARYPRSASAELARTRLRPEGSHARR